MGAFSCKHMSHAPPTAFARNTINLIAEGVGEIFPHDFDIDFKQELISRGHYSAEFIGKWSSMLVIVNTTGIRIRVTVFFHSLLHKKTLVKDTSIKCNLEKRTPQRAAKHVLRRIRESSKDTLNAIRRSNRRAQREATALVHRGEIRKLAGWSTVKTDTSDPNDFPRSCFLTNLTAYGDRVNMSLSVFLSAPEAKQLLTYIRQEFGK